MLLRLFVSCYRRAPQPAVRPGSIPHRTSVISQHRWRDHSRLATLPGPFSNVVAKGLAGERQSRGRGKAVGAVRLIGHKTHCLAVQDPQGGKCGRANGPDTGLLVALANVYCSRHGINLVPAQQSHVGHSESGVIQDTGNRVIPQPAESCRRHTLGAIPRLQQDTQGRGGEAGRLTSPRLGHSDCEGGIVVPPAFANHEGIKAPTTRHVPGERTGTPPGGEPLPDVSRQVIRHEIEHFLAAEGCPARNETDVERIRLERTGAYGIVPLGA